MTKEQILNMWHYYLTLENDLSATSQFIEPLNQENSYSFAFYKIIVLSCTEIESIFKILTKEITGVEKGDISGYKEDILLKYPNIVDSVVFVERWQKNIKPFESWKTSKLEWWSAYNSIKHNRKGNFNKSTYLNAVYCVSALYVLILYLCKIFNVEINDSNSAYIISDYSHQIICASPSIDLPDFPTKKEDGVLSLNSLSNLTKQ